MNLVPLHQTPWQVWTGLVYFPLLLKKIYVPVLIRDFYDRPIGEIILRRCKKGLNGV